MIENIILHTGSIILLFNVILYFKTSIKSRSLKVFKTYLFVILLIELYSKLLWYKAHNNLFLSHYYFILQFILLSIFYHSIFSSKQNKSSVKILSSIIIITLGIQYITNPSVYFKFNLLEIVLTSLTLVTYSVIHFYNSLIEKSKYIYINSGIFIYLLGSTLIFCSGNFLELFSPGYKKTLWFINSFLIVVYQVFIFIEWYKNIRNKA